MEEKSYEAGCIEVKEEPGRLWQYSDAWVRSAMSKIKIDYSCEEHSHIVGH